MTLPRTPNPCTMHLPNPEVPLHRLEEDGVIRVAVPVRQDDEAGRA